MLDNNIVYLQWHFGGMKKSTKCITLSGTKGLERKALLFIIHVLLSVTNRSNGAIVLTRLTILKDW